MNLQCLCSQISSGLPYTIKADFQSVEFSERAGNSIVYDRKYRSEIKWIVKAEQPLLLKIPLSLEIPLPGEWPLTILRVCLIGNSKPTKF